MDRIRLTVNGVFNDHFKVRNEISYNTSKLEHFGEWVDPSKTSANADKLRGHKGQANNFDLGMQLEFYPLSLTEFQSYRFKFSPFITLGAHYTFSSVKASTTYQNPDPSAIGDIENPTHLPADFAYVIPTGENTNLSFGAKAGLTTFDANLSGLDLNDPNDPAFENINEIFPVFGVGAFWFGDNHYLGVSAPNLLTSEHLDNSQLLRDRGTEEIHYYLTGGYVFNISDNFKLKPSTMVRGVKGAPLSVDVNANVLLYDKLEAGLGYRFDESITGLVNFRITQGLRIGYAYDYPTYDLSNDGSHEIMLLFDFDLFGLNKGYDKSPRFF